MSEQTTSTTASRPGAGTAAQRLGPGLHHLRGVMMILAGSFQAFAGLVAIFDDEFYVTTPKYVLEFDSTSWGWIHLLMGLVVLFAGLRGDVRPDLGPHVGVILAVLSAVANFAFIPYYPFWSMTDHRGGHVRHLGADGPRPRHHPLNRVVVTDTTRRHVGPGIAHARLPAPDRAGRRSFGSSLLLGPPP